MDQELVDKLNQNLISLDKEITGHNEYKHYIEKAVNNFIEDNSNEFDISFLGNDIYTQAIEAFLIINPEDNSLPFYELQLENKLFFRAIKSLYSEGFSNSYFRNSFSPFMLVGTDANLKGNSLYINLLRADDHSFVAQYDYTSLEVFMKAGLKGYELITKENSDEDEKENIKESLREFQVKIDEILKDNIESTETNE
ncbi:hypothetical protein [Salipaludibacillus sp. CF4.18]|uniref:hypothetical protein n=1 Tax=Salipaludibacillus sp. CF4.18 TaxID=3373081 RepID=UPI003EE543B7